MIRHAGAQRLAAAQPNGVPITICHSGGVVIAASSVCRCIDKRRTIGLWAFISWDLKADSAPGTLGWTILGDA